MTLKVGLLVGREWSFPPAFIEEVNRRDEGVIAEFIQLGGTRMDEPCPYAVIIDRISQEVPYYRIYLKYAVLQGVTVVNNPFMWTADDKFFEASLATKLGVASPKTVVLPNKEYVPGIVHDESLRNLVYPLDWHGIINYVGLPCVLKDALGGGGKDVFICHSLEELLFHYNQFGLRTTVVEEFIVWEQYIRCIALGQEEVLPIKYDPGERKYHVRARASQPRTWPSRRGGFAQARTRAGVRYEFSRVGRSQWHSVRYRFHEPRARHGYLFADPILFRLGSQAHG